MAKILITGAAGYIGSILVPELLSKNHQVIALDNFMYKQTSLLDCCSNKNFNLIRGDCRDEKLISDCLKTADYIFPLACFTGAPLCEADKIGAKSTNLDAIKTILKLRKKNQKIIFPTTNSGYGIGQEGIYCNEETPLNPISFYGKLKVQAETAILKDKNSITLRLATVFGISPRMRLDLLVNDFVFRAINDKYVVLFEPHFKRNYVHVRDVAGAFLHCLDNFDKMKNQTYNLGLSQANLSKLELCLKIKEQVPDFIFLESKIGKDPDRRNYIVSNEKIEKAGFRPRVSLEEGIRELVKGYQIIKKNQFSNI
jgi:nucleoside-diphosphate-sugar epimerase